MTPEAPEAAEAPEARAAPATRWALGGQANDYYGRKFAELLAAGEDVDGEARLADALLNRGARVLDAGAGMGRVGAALQRRGHRVAAVEPDPALVAQARRTFPDLDVVAADILDLTPELLARHGLPTEYDLVVCVGNVMIFLAEGTEGAVLARLRGLLAEGGRMLVGFHPAAGPSTSRVYPPAEFAADAEAAGLRVDLRAGSYALHPPTEEYTVWVLSAEAAPAADGPDRPDAGRPDPR